MAERLSRDNPWWSNPEWQDPAAAWPRRGYFDPLIELARRPVQRAIVLLGARRVGKTTLLRQLIDEANQTREFGPVLFASVDTPTYTNLGLEDLLGLFEDGCDHDPMGPRLVVFDEIQYLADWERHVKDLVDRYPRTQFIVSGSAGAALKRKSTESGAGRFTDFELPPLTFAEYLDFREATAALLEGEGPRFTVRDASGLDEHFVEYINFGGYPEVARSETIRRDMGRFVRDDIVQKVLLQDLPSLYGITNIPELNRLFTTVAYNSGQLVSLEQLSGGAGIAKPTISRYLEYLEAAFLIVRMRRVDQTARRLKRERNFKVFLTNPSMRAALFSPLAADDPAMGALVETALVTQYLHAPMFRDLCFARWSKGEVDLVRLHPARQRPVWAVEVKWSDGAHRSGKSWSPLRELGARSELRGICMTSRTVRDTLSPFEGAGSPRQVVPVSWLAYAVGRLAARQELAGWNEGLPFDLLGDPPDVDPERP